MPDRTARMGLLAHPGQALAVRAQAVRSHGPSSGGRRGVDMAWLIFTVGTLLGVLAGGALCVRYLRREVAADIGPRLRRLQLQLDNLEAAINLTLVTRYAELSERPLRGPKPPPPDIGTT